MSGTFSKHNAYSRFFSDMSNSLLIQVLEENGGLILGSSSGGSEADVSFKPQQADLSEFIKQSNECGISQVIVSMLTSCLSRRSR